MHNCSSRNYHCASGRSTLQQLPVEYQWCYQIPEFINLKHIISAPILRMDAEYKCNNKRILVLIDLNAFCITENCGSPPEPNNGTVLLNRNGLTTYKASATQSCNRGFSFCGNNTITCLCSGIWSQSITCKIIGIMHIMTFCVFCESIRLCCSFC